MSTKHFWDIGVDWDVGLDFDERHYLQTGFFTVGSGIDTPVNLQKNNSVAFNIYDTTPESKVTGIVSIEVTFKKLYPAQPANSPFDGPNPLRLSIGPQQPSCFSTPFKGNFPCWNCSPPQMLKNDGRFLMQIVIVGNGPPGEPPKTWMVDPEMLIGGGG